MAVRKCVVRGMVGAAIWAALVGVAWAQSGGMRIGARDVLHITTWNEPTLTGDYTVGPDGKLVFPLIGPIQAEGLTPRELEESLKNALGAKYLRNPQVTVELQQTTNKHVNVIGEVRAPGAYPFAGTITLLDALARAGSTTDTAGEVARLCHDGSTDDASTPPGAAGGCTPVDLYDLLSGTSQKNNVALQDGDTVIVPKADPVYVTGYVKAPGAYPAPRGTTVLQVVTLAGGTSAAGKMSGITILRKVPGKKDPQKLKVNDPKTEVVTPGDTINVPKSFFGGGGE